MRMHWMRRAAVVLFVLITAAACAPVYSQGRGNYPNDPSSRGGIYRGGGYVDTAYQRGFDDGYARGRDAARDGDRYDPRRERWYRSADRGYSSRSGSHSEYRQTYRDAFTRGYDLGYRDGRYESRGYRR